MNELQLVDVWRDRSPECKEYTWSNSAKTKFSRIDFMLISKGLDTRTENILFLPSIQSDHRAIYASIRSIKTIRGAGYWKFNNTNLDNPEFIQRVSDVLNNVLNKKPHQNACAKWEDLKKEVKLCSQKFAREVVTEERIAEAQLVECIQGYESNQPLNKNDTELLLQSKADLDEILTKRASASLFRSKCRWYELGEKNTKYFRSKCRWYELGEKNTKYFFNLEKRRSNAKDCHCLLTEQNVLTTDLEEILDIQHNFYQDL